MGYNLTTKQKSFLKWVVNKIREGEIDEEFHIAWGSDSFFSYTKDGIKKTKYDGELITKGFFHPLDKLGILFSNPQYDERGHEKERFCTAPPKLFEFVDSDFDETVIPHEVRQVTQRILDNNPECDEVIIEYLKEAICCLENNAKLATAIMLGGASEKAIYLLIDSYLNNVKNTQNQEKLKNRLGSRDISRKFEVFKESFNLTM